jgi:dienelactone hydrolase
MESTMMERAKEHVVKIAVDAEVIEGSLVVPCEATGMVIFAHGSGSSRHSPRNRFVAGELNETGLATLLIDLLTEKEGEIDDRTRALRFDIDLLASRVIGAIDWVHSQKRLHALRIGCFGASTGSAGALVAASRRPDEVTAVVSRGGRPDLASDVLPGVQASTLLIVGGKDPVVIDMNKQAMKLLNAEKKLEIVPGATHLFQEPGTLEVVSRLARNWFNDKLSAL